MSVLNTVRWELLTRDRAHAGVLSVEHGSGTLRESIYTDIRTGGSLSTRDTAVDWDQYLIRPILTVNGVEHVLATLIPAVATVRTTASARLTPITLYDRSLILRQAKTITSFTAPAGAAPTDLVVEILRNRIGETTWAVTPSTERLSAPMVWEPLTPWVRIINDLLDAINYFALWADEAGTFTAAPYVPPADRPEVHSFVDDATGTYLPEFDRERDTFEVPNRITLVARPVNDTTPALTATARNMDHRSPFSYPSRGRWIDDGEMNVEATSQSVLDALAARRLAEASTVAGRTQFTHAWLPLPLHAAARFINDRTGQEARGTVTEKETRFGTAILTRTSIREHA